MKNLSREFGCFAGYFRSKRRFLSELIVGAGRRGAPWHLLAYRSAMSDIIFIVEGAPEGGCEADALRHAIFTEAETLQELKARVRDAVLRHFEEPERRTRTA